MLFFGRTHALAYSRSKAHSEHTLLSLNEFLAQLDGMGRDNCSVLILAHQHARGRTTELMWCPERLAFRSSSRRPTPKPAGKCGDQAHPGPEDSLNLAALAQRTVNFSGADIDGLIELAKEAALHDAVLNNNERLSCLFGQGARAINTLDARLAAHARNLVKYAGDDGSLAMSRPIKRRPSLSDTATKAGPVPAARRAGWFYRVIWR